MGGVGLSASLLPGGLGRGFLCCAFTSPKLKVAVDDAAAAERLKGGVWPEGPGDGRVRGDDCKFGVEDDADGTDGIGRDGTEIVPEEDPVRLKAGDGARRGFAVGALGGERLGSDKSIAEAEIGPGGLFLDNMGPGGFCVNTGPCDVGRLLPGKVFCGGEFEEIVILLELTLAVVKKKKCLGDLKKCLWLELFEVIVISWELMILQPVLKKAFVMEALEAIDVSLLKKKKDWLMKKMSFVMEVLEVTDVLIELKKVEMKKNFQLLLLLLMMMIVV